jgi:hypothetical protein
LEARLKTLQVARAVLALIAVNILAYQAEAGPMPIPATVKPLAAPGGKRALLVDYTAVKKQTHIAQCVTSKITMLGPRLCTPDAKGNCPAKLPFDDSGDSVAAANGIPGVSYDRIPALEKSKLGDKVKICLDNVPINCPPGDDRGFNWTWKNLRTGGTWSLPDAEHRCGGA